MTKKKLFEYAVLFHHKDDGTQLIVEPTYTLALNQDEVKLHAARDIEDTHAEQMDRVEVIVRPF